MRRTLARMYWLAPGLVAAACGGETGELFGPGGGASGANGRGGSQVASGGTVGNAGAQAEGGAPVSGGAGQAAAGGSAGTSNVSGGASGNAGGGGTAGKGGASGAAGSAGAGGSAGKSGAGGSAGKGGAGGSAGKGGAGGGAGSAGKGGSGGNAGAVGTGGVSSAGAGGQAMCDAARAELPKLLTAAQVCDVSLDRLPCTGFVNNECGCKVPVDGPNLPAAQSYVNAVAAVSKCGVICPAIVCAEPVATRCQTEGTLTKGHCVVGPPL